MPEHSRPSDSGFDLRARAELRMAYDAGESPTSLFRHSTPLWSRRSFQRSALVLLLTGGGTGAVMGQRPPELVRHVIDHEYFERALRGTLMAPAQMLARIGLQGEKKLPGFTQLLRPCDIDGHLVYHLTTFFDKSGMLTLFAFDQHVSLPNGDGWWNNVYWQVMRSKDGNPLVFIAKQKSTLTLAKAALLGTGPVAG